MLTLLSFAASPNEDSCTVSSNAHDEQMVVVLSFLLVAGELSISWLQDPQTLTRCFIVAG